MVKMGMNVSKFFYGGHSLGGSSISAWVADNSADAIGTFVMGAYTSAKFKDPAVDYPTPFLTIGAEFDGWMGRITRIARSYDLMQGSSIGLEKSRYRYPVVMVPGLDHAAFLNGTVPPTV